MNIEFDIRKIYNLKNDELIKIIENTNNSYAITNYGNIISLNNTILLKSAPISDTNRTVLPLRPTKLYVSIKINDAIYNDYLKLEQIFFRNFAWKRKNIINK